MLSHALSHHGWPTDNMILFSKLSQVIIHNIHAHCSCISPCIHQHPCPFFMHITLYSPTIPCDLLLTGYPIISTSHPGRSAARQGWRPHASSCHTGPLTSHNAPATYLSSNTRLERRAACAMNSFMSPWASSPYTWSTRHWRPCSAACADGRHELRGVHSEDTHRQRPLPETWHEFMAQAKADRLSYDQAIGVRNLIGCWTSQWSREEGWAVCWGLQKQATTNQRYTKGSTNGVQHRRSTRRPSQRRWA
jgi:hypothetical protein